MSLLPGVLTRNLSLKLAAVALALLLWVSVRAETPTRQELPGIPIRVQLSDPEWELAGNPVPATVDIRVTGPTRELLRLSLDRPVVVIPIDDVTGADTAVVIAREWLRMGSRPGVTVEDFQPSSIRLSFEPLATASVPVALRFIDGGEGPADPLGRPRPEPTSLRVTGPREWVDGLDSIRLAPLDPEGVRAAGALRVAIDTAGIGRVRVSADSVTVRWIVEAPVDRIITGRPIWTEGTGLRPDIEVRPRTLSVTLRGARSAVQAIVPEEIRVLVELPRSEEMEVGREFRAPIRVLGGGAWVRAIPSIDSVTVWRTGSGIPDAAPTPSPDAPLPVPLDDADTLSVEGR